MVRIRLPFLDAADRRQRLEHGLPVTRDLDLWSSGRKREQPDAISWRELFDELRDAGHGVAALPVTDVGAIDDEQHDPAGRADVVRTDPGQAPRGRRHRVLGRVDELRRHDLTGLPVHGEDEIIGAEAFDGPALVRHDQRIDRDQVHAASKQGRLRLLASRSHERDGPGGCRRCHPTNATSGHRSTLLVGLAAPTYQKTGSTGF